MPAKKPAKPTRLQKKADKKDKVLTGPKGSKPQSTTTNRVRAQGGTTISKPKGGGAGRRTNPKAAKPATPAKAPSSQSADAKRFQQLNQSKSARDGKAQELRQQRTAARAAKPAPGTGNVLQSAIDRSKALKDAARQANRTRVATRDAARASGARGAVAAVAGEAANRVLGPAAQKAGSALANRLLIPAARKLDDAMPGVNSKDEARRRNAQAAAKGSSSKFKGARDTAMKKASAIKGSPVVGPRKSFDDTFRDARKAGKKEFTWKGKKYTTKMK